MTGYGLVIVATAAVVSLAWWLVVVRELRRHNRRSEVYRDIASRRAERTEL